LSAWGYEEDDREELTFHKDIRGNLLLGSFRIGITRVVFGFSNAIDNGNKLP